MSISRRKFVRLGTTSTCLAALSPHSLISQSLRRIAFLGSEAAAAPTDIGKMKELALKAVEAAKGAGATYADVCLSRTVKQDMLMSQAIRAVVNDEEEYGFCVRALMDGVWGFASSPYWNDNECAALAKSAVAQGRVNAAIRPRQVDLGTFERATGHWTSVGTDPFSVSIEEKTDFMNGWRLAIHDSYFKEYRVTPLQGSLNFTREDWCMASTEGAAISQTLYTAQGLYALGGRYRDQDLAAEHGESSARALHIHAQRGGWDVILNAKLTDQIPPMIQRAVSGGTRQQTPADIGRFDVVFDAASTAKLIEGSFGTAAQLDRALGYEANAGGTSYLGPNPHQFLGGAAIASPLINIRANRTIPWGLSTVKWDHEAVQPDDFQLVDRGILVDYQTTREQAFWIKDWYTKRQMPIRSHGCSWSPSATHIPMQHTPNLMMTPASTTDTFETLVAGIDKGIAVFGAYPIFDFQSKNGIIITDNIRQITNGKLGDWIKGAGILFNTTELWKNVMAIGGQGSEQPAEGRSVKGQPQQYCRYSISAVPMAVKNVSVIDALRRA